MKIICFLAAILGMASGVRATVDQQTHTIRTLSGKTYEQCRILKAYPDGLAFSHANGAAQVPFALLGEEWRKKFNYNPETAENYVAEHLAAERESQRRQRERRAAQSQLKEDRVFAAQRLHERPANSFPYGGDWVGGGFDDWQTFDSARGSRRCRSSCYPRRYQAGCNVFPVRNLTTFGGYRYPTQISHGSCRPCVPRYWNRPSPSAFRAPCRTISSGGLRVGGTGGLIQVSSPFIGHR